MNSVSIDAMERFRDLFDFQIGAIGCGSNRHTLQGPLPALCARIASGSRSVWLENQNWTFLAFFRRLAARPKKAKKVEIQTRRSNEP
jgi:hypothetical protein